MADEPNSETCVADFKKILSSLQNCSEGGVKRERIQFLESLLHWSSTTHFHALTEARLRQIVPAVLNVFKNQTFVFLEDWQGTFDCIDMILYRLKSIGFYFVDDFWNLIAVLANRLNLSSQNGCPPEFQMLVLRPLFVTSSILINLHGPEGWIRLCSTPYAENVSFLKKNYRLLELAVRFVIRGILFFPHHTFAAGHTAAFFVNMAVENSVSIIRRAALEGLKALHMAKEGCRDVGEIFEVVDTLKRELGDKSACEAFRARIKRKEGPTLDTDFQVVQLWLDVHCPQAKVKTSADIAWILACDDEYLPLCVCEYSCDGPEEVRDKASEKILVLSEAEEAGDTQLIARNRPRKTADVGGGDRIVDRKKQLTSSSKKILTSVKMTSNTSLSTYVVDEELREAIPSDGNNSGVHLVPKLTGWVEKDEIFNIDSPMDDDKVTAELLLTHRLSGVTVTVGDLKDDQDLDDSPKPKPRTSRGVTAVRKAKPLVEIESKESAQEFYIGSPPTSIVASVSHTFPAKENHDTSLQPANIRPARRKKIVKAKSIDSNGSSFGSTMISGQTTRLSKALGQLNSTWDSENFSAKSTEITHQETVQKKTLVQRTAEIKPKEECTDSELRVEQFSLPVASRKVSPVDSSDVRTKKIRTKSRQGRVQKPPVAPSDPFDPEIPIVKLLARSAKLEYESEQYETSSELTYRNSPNHPTATEVIVFPERTRPTAKIPKTNKQRTLADCGDSSPKSNLGQIYEPTSSDGNRLLLSELMRKRIKTVSSEQPSEPPSARLVCNKERSLELDGNNFPSAFPQKNLSKGSGLDSLFDETMRTSKYVRKGSRQEADGSEAASDFSQNKKPEESRADLQMLLDRMQKGPRYSSDIVRAIEEFVQLTKTNPRMVESAIGVAFSHFLPLIYNLNSHVAAEAVAALEILMPLVERKLHLVAPQIVEALSNNMQNARTSDHSKKVFNQILTMQEDRAGGFLAPLSSHIATIMKKNKKEAFAFITCKYAQTLGRAFPKPPKCIAAAVQILTFVKSVLAWITNYGDLDSSAKPEIIAVDALIQQTIRSFGLQTVNKVCYDYRDTINVFLSRRPNFSSIPVITSGGPKSQKLVVRKSSLMAFRKKAR